MVTHYVDNRGNSRANTCKRFRLSREGTYLLDPKPTRVGLGSARLKLVIHDNWSNRIGPRAGDGSFKFLPYQLSMVGYWPTMVATGDGELGFDSGEGA